MITTAILVGPGAVQTHLVTPEVMELCLRSPSRALVSACGVEGTTAPNACPLESRDCPACVATLRAARARPKRACWLRRLMSGAVMSRWRSVSTPRGEHSEGESVEELRKKLAEDPWSNGGKDSSVAAIPAPRAGTATAAGTARRRAAAHSAQPASSSG
ncbi:hypothetical protein [Allokutzneria multivorans]|uniref:hypothetical protein n=1 Tax=Allokutzneria multivorans TaxID=1142134 RepID=UPI0031E9B73B